MSDLLIARARALDGAFTWADAHALGVRSDELARLVTRQVVHRISSRAYVLDEAVRAAPSAEAKHRLKALAVVRSFDGRVAASHQSALAVHGLPFWQVDDSRVHVSRLRGTTSRCRDLLTVHEAYPQGATTRSEATGVWTVAPALAVIGTAMTSGETAGVVAADAALHEGLTTREELDSWLDRLRRRPGLVAARRAVAAADHRSESVGESRTRLVLQAMPDLPPITLQHEFRDEHGVVWARCDLLVGEHLVVEFDGRVKYRAGADSGGSSVSPGPGAGSGSGSGSGSASVSPEEVVWAEKLREDRIRRQGKVVVRVVWSDLDRPALVQARVRTGLRDVERMHGRSAA